MVVPRLVLPGLFNQRLWMRVIPKRTRSVFACTALALLLLVFAALAALSLNSKSDRRISGKRLSEHLLLAYAAGSGTNDSAVISRKLILEEGTNALPLLSQWLQAKTPHWKIELGRKLWTLGIRTSQFPPEEKEIVACRAIGHLQRDGLTVAPALAASCTNSNHKLAHFAAMTLWNQAIRWPQEISAEIEYALRPSLENSIKVLDAQLRQSTNSNLLKERLVLLKNVQRRFTMKPSSEVLAVGLKEASLEAQARSLRVLSRRGDHYQNSEAMLIAHLQSPSAGIAQNAAASLKNYGAHASNALPHLQKALSHPDVGVRSEASNAISRITALSQK